MSNLLKKIPGELKFLGVIYLSGLLLFTLFRLLLYVISHSATENIPGVWVANAFLLGFRFDTVISGYLLSLPFVLFLLFFFARISPARLSTFLAFYLSLIYIIVFFICAADLPWFVHQQTRLTVSALHWTDSPGMMAGIIFNDSNNYPFIALFIFISVLFIWLTFKFSNRILLRLQRSPVNARTISIFIITGLILFLGIRGRLAIKSPIRWGTAFVSNYNFTNQLGLNPAYSFLQSWLDEKNPKNNRLDVMDDNKAKVLISNYYKTGLYSPTPVSRQVKPQGKENRLNVIIVLMESMSALNMGTYGNPAQLTPCLDSVYRHALVYRNFYSDGIHTFCGLYSSLFGMPSLPNRHHMKDLKYFQPYDGMASQLKNLGYSTVFFTTHDEQFDNMGGFLSANGFENIISEKDYLTKDVIGTLGIPDHVLFDESISRLNTISNNGKAFLAAILTASNHGPYEFPENISLKYKSSEMITRAIEYADWSIGHFLNQAAKQKWFNNTIFIFTGDHGMLNAGADMYLSYLHVPLLIYSPGNVAPAINTNPGGQVDIFPTVMGILNLPYYNNSFGMDLGKEERKFVTSTYDSDVLTFSDNGIYINRVSQSGLFKIENDRILQPDDNAALADSMQQYAKAIMQTKQWMLENRKMMVKYH
jgi:phosphoglycerol transferase MdoB-like AlkP superfamily enzyme